jgi:hypothetical protein
VAFLGTLQCVISAGAWYVLIVSVASSTTSAGLSQPKMLLGIQQPMAWLGSAQHLGVTVFDRNSVYVSISNNIIYLVLCAEMLFSTFAVWGKLSIQHVFGIDKFLSD